MRLLALLVTVIIPGAGHVFLGYLLRGLAIFSVAGLLLDGFVYGLYGPGGASTSRLTLFCASTAIIIWLYAVIDTWHLAFGRYGRRAISKRMALFRDGLISLLTRESRVAIRRLRSAQRLDPDDVDVLYYLALAHASEMRLARARRILKRCANLDHAGRWRTEVDSLLALVKERGKRNPP